MTERASSIIGFSGPVTGNQPTIADQRQALLAADDRLVLAPDGTALTACLSELRDGDLLVVAAPQIIAPTVAGLLAILADLDSRGVALAVLDLSGKVVQFSDADGKAMRTLLEGVAAWEAPAWQQRAIERPPARRTGRPATIAPDMVRQRLQGGVSASVLARELGIARSSVYRVGKSPELGSILREERLESGATP